MDNKHIVQTIAISERMIDSAIEEYDNLTAEQEEVDIEALVLGIYLSMVVTNVAEEALGNAIPAYEAHISENVELH